MPTDPEYLFRHHASLSDEALLEIDRAELVETAQKCYDDELERRKLPSQRISLPGSAEVEDKPEWLGEANEVFSQLNYAGAVAAPEIANARAALEAAGIPCFVDISDQEEEPPPQKSMKVWRLMVPGNLNQRAASILERDIFNCGLFDRVERVTRAFDEEIARRGSNTRAPCFS